MSHRLKVRGLCLNRNARWAVGIVTAQNDHTAVTPPQLIVTLERLHRSCRSKADSHTRTVAPAQTVTLNTVTSKLCAPVVRPHESCYTRRCIIMSHALMWWSETWLSQCLSVGIRCDCTAVCWWETWPFQYWCKMWLSQDPMHWWETWRSQYHSVLTRDVTVPRPQCVDERRDGPNTTVCWWETWRSQYHNVLTRNVTVPRPQCVDERRDGPNTTVCWWETWRS